MSEYELVAKKVNQTIGELIAHFNDGSHERELGVILIVAEEGGLGRSLGSNIEKTGAIKELEYAIRKIKETMGN